jgi:hypothetical protein
MSDRDPRVAKYIGLTQIAQRLKCSIPHVRKLHATKGLLLYRDNLAGVRPGSRGWAWVTNDDLIQTWLMARCMADRQFIPPGADRLANAETASGR